MNCDKERKQEKVKKKRQNKRIAEQDKQHKIKQN